MHEERIEYPDLEQYPDVPVFNTKAVVQQTGVPAPTLRAWERRYAILSPERANNDYRLYSERDIVIIRWLKERVDSGMAISHATSLFRRLNEESRHRPEDAPFLQLEPAGPGRQLEAGKALTGPVALHIFGKDGQIGQTLSTTVSFSPHSLSIVQKRLIDAFHVMDEAVAGALMASTLAIYPIEQVCTDLITPTLWKIGELWEQGRLTVSVEHFASAFFRGLLTNLLHVTPVPAHGPLILNCCAPGEAHELGALMLTLLLKRAGIRVAYLGQSIEIAGLLHTTRRLLPSLICVSMTLAFYVDSVIDLGVRIQELPPPRPLLVFGGQGFASLGDTLLEIPGIYLKGDMPVIIAHLRELLSRKI